MVEGISPLLQRAVYTKKGGKKKREKCRVAQGNDLIPKGAEKQGEQGTTSTKPHMRKVES